MNTLIVGMLAETFIHPGSGRNNGVIDLPVARETATDYPYIAGQSGKGALKDHARQQRYQPLDTLFGNPGQGGAFRSGDARLLLLPVRSLSGAYKWATCPHLLERFLRDCRRCGKNVAMTIPMPKLKEVYCDGAGVLFLEECHYTITGAIDASVAAALEILVCHSETRKRLASQIAILSDDDFAWFARYGLAVQARNQLDETTKESNNLWYEETLPPDTLMYSILSESQPGGIASVENLLKAQPYLQIGGNETVGQGWFALTVVKPAGGNHA